MKAVRIAGLAVLFAMAIGFARADLRFDAETGAVYDNNLPIRTVHGYER